MADEGGVYDDAWANAAKHFDDAQLGALVCLIALINLYNRLNAITTRHCEILPMARETHA